MPAGVDGAGDVVTRPHAPELAGATARDPMRLRAHPSFPQVLARFCDQVVAPLRGQRLMIKLFGQRAPTEIVAHIIVMHVEARTPQQRPTLSRLQQRLPGPRQTAAFVTLLRGLGLVSAERDPDDARIRYLVPGPVIFDGLRDWLALHLSCYRELAEAPDWPARLRTDINYFHGLIRQFAPWLDRANRPLTRHPDLAWSDEHDSGLYLALLLVALQSAAPADGVPVAVGDWSAVLGVSRSHIRNLLGMLESRGLAAITDGRLVLTPRFMAVVESWFCHQVAWIAAAAARAEPATPRPPAIAQTMATRPLPMS
jgi:hypothetical protein